MEEPKMFPAVLLGTIAVICIIPAWLNEDWPDWLRVTLALIGVFLFFYAGLVTLRWVVYNYDQHTFQAARAAAITPDAEIIHAYARLQPYQAEALLRRSAALEAKPGVAGPEMVFDVDGVKIPSEFVYEFLENCGTEYLYPIRRYSEGSKYREWATAITNFYITRNIANMAVGDKPARWRYPYEDAVRWFGMTMEGV